MAAQICISTLLSFSTTSVMNSERVCGEGGREEKEGRREEEATKTLIAPKENTKIIGDLSP